MLSPQERLRILLDEMQQLEEYLTNLPKEAWDQPSACAEWCVADVVAHLTSNSKNNASRLLRALQGDVSPDDLSPPRGSGSVDPVSAAQRIIAFRKQFGKPDAILPEYLASNRQFSEATAMVGPDDWNKSSYRPAGPVPISNIVDVVLAEQTVHGWDIRSRFDPGAGLPPTAVPVLVEWVAQRPRWSFRAGPSPLPLRYRFEVTAPTPYSADVVVTEEAQNMEVASDKDAQVTFRSNGETYVMLMYGRITAREAIADGRVSYEGDQQLVAAFAERFVGG